MYDFVQTDAVVCQIVIVNLRSFRCHLNQSLANIDDCNVNQLALQGGHLSASETQFFYCVDVWMWIGGQKSGGGHDQKQT